MIDGESLCFLYFSYLFSQNDHLSIVHGTDYPMVELYRMGDSIGTAHDSFYYAVVPFRTISDCNARLCHTYCFYYSIVPACPGVVMMFNNGKISNGGQLQHSEVFKEYLSEDC